MKKTLLILALLIIVIFAGNLYPQDEEFINAMVKAKKNLNTALNTYDEKDLLKVRGEFERTLQLKKNVWVVYYFMGLVDYHLATSFMSEKKKDNEKVKKYTESGLANTDKSLETRDDFADTYVLRMALQYNRWSYEPDKMGNIINASTLADETAKRLEPLNPRYHLMKGVSLLYTPEAFGGGVNPSLEYLNKAYDIYQTRKELEVYYPDWGYDMTCGLIATAYMKRDKEGDLEKAKTYLDKGLEINPQNGFLMSVKKQYEEKKK
jgi:tetratricopeptide (TPR) repeat protein